MVYHRRPGGQSQFSELLALDPPSDRIRQCARLSPAPTFHESPVGRAPGRRRLPQPAREFGRAFLAETGQTPAKAIERLRVEAARLRLETCQEPIELIARSVGFADPERMRRAFLRVFGQPPQSLRRVARGAATVG